MKYFSAAFGLACFLAAAPAMAQLSGGPGGSSGTPQPQAPVPDIAPSGVPGAGNAPLATGPNLHKTASGDPTQELFTAVNAGDYNSAQDALSRGADLTAQNAFGETPLDLSVALNRSSITFLLLAARNESGGGGGADVDAGPIPTAPMPGHHHHHLRATPVTDEPAPSPAAPKALGNNPGTPDPSAGFLGFGNKS